MSTARRGAGAVKRGGLETRLAPSRPIPLHIVKCDLLRPSGSRGAPVSRSVPNRAKALGANLGANVDETL